MAITWGSTVGAETAAQRYARDVAQRGGDVKYTYDGAGLPVKSTVAASAAGGRNDRDFDKRGGDVYYTYSGLTPVRNVNANGRNKRQYVNAADNSSPLATNFG